MAALQEGEAAVLGLIDHCFDKHAEPGEAVAAWFAASARLLTDSGYESGCPIATVALETLVGPAAVSQAARAAFAAWESRLASRLRRAGLGRTRAAEAAVGVLALLEGALLLSRVQASTGPMRTAARQAEAIVSRSLSGG